jgi:6-pyruvoyltetrahydropterin/6-carboxytetrahydropterin synthase
MITATRYHDICTGHRVLGHEGKCSTLHGHGYRIHFTCMGELDPLGRVLDFSCINERLCMWVEREWDHKTILFYKDPLRESIPAVHLWVSEFNPTAENMADYLLRVVGPQQLQGTGVILIKVIVEETPKCSAESSL